MRKTAPVLFLSLLAAIGCGSGGSSNSSAAVTLSPSTVQTLDAGQSVTFTAAVSGDSTNAGVTWQLQGVGVLSNETASTAVYTAPSSLAGGNTVAVEAIPLVNNRTSAMTLLNIFPALSITTSTAPAATIHTAYSLQLASTGGNGTITWALASGSLPTGLTMSAKGFISGSPSAYGSYSFVVSATDSVTTPTTTTQTLTIVVQAVTLAITSASVPNVVTGAGYSDTLALTGGIGPYTWSVASGTLPAGIMLSPAGVLSGSSTATGSYNFAVQVTDTEATPQVAQKNFTLIVYSKLAIATASLPNGAVNASYTQTLQSTGGTAPITWTTLPGSLPAGLNLSGTGVISGTPTSAGTSTFTVQAADTSVPQQTTTVTYNLTIVAPVAIVTTSLPPGTLNIAYTTTLVSSGGNAPVTWALANGTSLPTGLTLSPGGVISGTPAAIGTTNFTVQATDATPATVMQALTLSVTALAPLKVSTTPAPPNGNTGVAYSTTFAATGGAIPYSWTLASGTLPPGLSLATTGALSGTPSTIGSYTFTVQVADGEPTPATATQQFTVVIANAGANAALTGTYAFLLNGFQSGSTNGAVYGFAAIGSLTADGAGGVTGIEDINTPSGVQQSLAVTGTYSLGTDGRGLVSLTAGATTASYAIAASQIVSGVAQSVAITEFDNATGTGPVASGFARLQTPAAFAAGSLMGTFAFGLSGESPCNTCTPSPKFGPVAAAGIITANGTATLSGGLEDAAAYGTNYSGITLAGSFTAPSATTGRGTLTLTPTGTLFSAPPSDFTYVIVSAKEFLLLSNDTHATTTLLYGDAQLQQQTTYAAATEFSGRSIGYESQASGGNGSTIYPTTLNAALYQITNTGSGTATLFQDSNSAGTLTTSNSATAVTYTTISNGRVAIATGGASNQVLYLYNTGAGFGLDLATSSGYPGLLQYELQVRTSVSLPPFPSGTFAGGTLAMPVAATVASGAYSFSLDSGGENPGSYNGTLATAIDSSTTAGILTSDQAGSFSTAESATGRQIVTSSPASSTPIGITYVISATRAVSIPATSGAEPAVTVLQQ